MWSVDPSWSLRPSLYGGLRGQNYLWNNTKPHFAFFTVKTVIVLDFITPWVGRLENVFYGVLDDKKAMADKTSDTLAWTKTVAPKCTISHCILHHQTLIVKQGKRKRPPVSLKNVLHENVNNNFININILVTKWEVHTKHFHYTPYMAVLRNNAYALVWAQFDPWIWQTFSWEWTMWVCHFKEHNQYFLPMIKFELLNKNKNFVKFASITISLKVSQYLNIFW